jgi:mannose-1-phosphate guanylyltransferase
LRHPARLRKDAADQLTSGLDFYRLADGPFAQAPKKSIDYAVMERAAPAAVLPVGFRWSNIGSWNAVWDAQQQDSSGNVIEGPAELMNTSNSQNHFHRSEHWWWRGVAEVTIGEEARLYHENESA